MLGSAAFCGVLPLHEALATEDIQGISVGTALAGHTGNLPLGRPFAAYFEAHIEQGPILEQAGLPIGVVTGGQAICWLDVLVTGSPAHAGTTPMRLRRDALFAASAMINRLEQLADEFQPHGLVTVGQLAIPGSSRNTIPGQVGFTIDLRHHQDTQIAAMEQRTRAVLQELAGQRGMAIDIQQHWFSAATPFDPDCIAAVQQAVTALGYPHQQIVSGAGHDAIHLARHCPTTMIFIPCVGGLSHHEAEDALPDDVRMGADVLLGAVLQQAGGRPQD
uniref:Peptidase M20 dimerisation domain-containing protein n=1 Tax=Anopheles coluzzii TaxID=1518534 RepID=A0A8W7PW90_ANOCL